MTTVLDVLASRLTASTAHNHATELPPVVVLWTDGDRKWEPALPALRKRLPHLWTLGDYTPALKQGPAAWVKWQLGQQGPTDPVPVLYLPGVRRLQFRSLEDFAESLKPIAELQFRGTWWTQQNGKDWTPLAFLTAKKAGLGLSVAEDADTLAALDGLVAHVLDASEAALRAPSRLEIDHFVALFTFDLEGDLLNWLDDPEGTRKGCPNSEWAVFRNFVRRRLEVDLDRDGPIVVGERLARRDGGWAKVWKRYSEAVSETTYARVHLVLEKAALVLMPDMSTQPKYNEQREQDLRSELAGLGSLPEVKVRGGVRALDAEHGPRRGWVWARLGKARLARALEHLVALADATEAPIVGNSLDALATWYAEAGHKADAAALSALAVAEHADGAAIHGVVRALYLPWLRTAADRLRNIVDASSYPKSSAVPIEDGTCLLFADGLRWDIGAMLADRLEAAGRLVARDGRWVAFPPVTGTSKPDVSPIRDRLHGGSGAGNFAPSTKDTNKPLDSLSFRKLMAEAGVQVLDNNNKTGDPTGRGWTEFGDIDKYGHLHGCKTARHVQDQLRELEQRIAELLNAGWKQVRVTTDHGWLLLPGGLPGLAIPGVLTDVKWQRCALAKLTSQVDLPTLPWAWDPTVRVVYPPGVDAFSLQTSHSREYAHGGLTLQECYTPVLTVSRPRPAVDGKLSDVKWVGLRCRVTVQTAASGLRVDLRAKVADDSTSFLLPEKGEEPTEGVDHAPRLVAADGTASLPVSDLNGERAGCAAFVVLLAPDGTELDKRPTTIGGDA